MNKFFTDTKNEHTATEGNCTSAFCILKIFEYTPRKQTFSLPKTFCSGHNLLKLKQHRLVRARRIMQFDYL